MLLERDNSSPACLCGARVSCGVKRGYPVTRWPGMWGKGFHQHRTTAEWLYRRCNDPQYMLSPYSWKRERNVSFISETQTLLEPRASSEEARIPLISVAPSPPSRQSPSAQGVNHPAPPEVGLHLRMLQPSGLSQTAAFQGRRARHNKTNTAENNMRRQRKREETKRARLQLPIMCMWRASCFPVLHN